MKQSFIRLGLVGALSMLVSVSPACAGSTGHGAVVSPATSVAKIVPSSDKDQARLLEAVATMTLRKKPNASPVDIGRRQLTALIAAAN